MTGTIIALLIAVFILYRLKMVGVKKDREIERKKQIDQAKAEKERQRKLDEEIRRLDENISYYEYGDVDEDKEDDL